MSDPIITEDGVKLEVGDHAYNYYDMKPGTIVGFHGFDGWFDFKHDDGTTQYLNGARICSDGFAKRRGFRDA